MSELLSLLCKKLLLKGNNITKSFYEANKLIKSLGLLAMIRSTPMKKDVFFRGSLKQLQVCPKCETARFMEGSRSIPWKIL